MKIYSIKLNFNYFILFNKLKIYHVQMVEKNKRTDEDSSSVPNKRIKTNEFNYSRFLQDINILANLIRYFCLTYKGNSDLPLIKKLREVSEKVPTIVVWGQQSSGKSSLLKKMFNFESKICTGIGTRCPIEIRSLPNFTESQFFVEQGIQKYGPFASISEAEKFIEPYKESSSGLLNNWKIIFEVPSKDSSPIIIVDLPGCIDSDQLYFERLKQNYLMRPETIVINVVRGDCDPKPDISMKYLQGITTKVITVLTNTDIWQNDSNKFAYLDQYDKLPNVTDIALVNIQDNEIEILNKFNYDHVKCKLIIGSTKLNEIIFYEQKNKVSEIKPYFMQCIQEIFSAIENEFKRIGKSKPDFREIVCELRNYLEDLIKNEFTSDNEYCKQIKQVTQKISKDQLKQFIQIPSEKEIAQKLQSGSRRKVQGAEGWDQLFKDYSKDFISKIKKCVEEFIDSYCQVIIKNICSVIGSKPYHICTVDVQKTIVNKINEIVQKHKETTKSLILEYLDGIAQDPYNGNDSYAQECFKNIIINTIRETLQFSKQFHTNSASANQQRLNVLPNATLTEESVYSMIAPKLNIDNIYTMNALFARNHIMGFWEIEIGEIHNTIINIVRKNLERAVENEIRKVVSKISSEDLCEPDEIDQQREKLIAIYDTCQEISDNLN